MKKFASIILGFIGFIGLQAQNETLLTINNKPVSLEEFKWIYNKNNSQAINDQKTVEEYLELFINYKLKVEEAIALGYDTTAGFKRELANYRDQLAKNYLVDREVNEDLLKEAYQRMLEDVRASHILIRLDPNSSPDDTLAAYNKAIHIRSRIINNGEGFETVARGTSDDPSVKNNGGDLGFFTVFQMVYPFETAAYSLNPGQISNPVRTRFGYHIIKVTDRRPAMGELRVAHIMLSTPKGMSTEEQEDVYEKIKDIHKKVTSGADFSWAAKEYSQDRGSAANGGELKWFTTGRMIPEFEIPAVALKKDGDISEPVKTAFGWHIIKRIEKKSIPEYDEIKSELRRKINRDSRSEKSKESFVSKLKEKYNYKIDSNALTEMIDVIHTENIESGKYMLTQKNKPIATLNNLTLKKSDFIEYLNRKRSMQKNADVWFFIQKEYNNFISDNLLELENKNLENSNIEFKYLMKEYHDGILLFEVMDDLVWSKASEDSIGLQNYYEKHKENYAWGKRAYVTKYTSKNTASLDALKKLLDKKPAKNYTTSYIVNKLNKKLDDENKTTAEEMIINKGEEDFGISWKENYQMTFKKTTEQETYYVDKITDGEIKPLNECRGLVIADYQEFLEKNWIEGLRNKYTIEVNNELLNSIE